jgi:Cof subfamily protein (haloacid dehalogenase superfamily)
MYRMVALDLDGTLLGPDGLLPEEHRKSLEIVRQMGLEVMLVTARTWTDTEPFVRELRLASPSICYTGAAMYDAEGAPIHCKLLEPTSLQQLATWADTEEWTMRIYHAGGLEVQSRLSNDYVNKVGAWFPEPHQYVSGLSDHVQTHHDALQVVLLGSRSVEAAHARLAEYAGVAATAYERLTPHARLHLFNLGVSKGASLEAYCVQRGIPRQSVIAMGDTAADNSMLTWAGVGVAMGWAPEHVRATADMVTSPNDSAPVSTALKQLLAL